AEILSYSRSRGLFAGLSLDGSAIEVDGMAHSMYYGGGGPQGTAPVPQSALQLIGDLNTFSQRGQPAAIAAGAIAPGGIVPNVAASTRQALATSAKSLYGV